MKLWIISLYARTCFCILVANVKVLLYIPNKPLWLMRLIYNMKIESAGSFHSSFVTIINNQFQFFQPSVRGFIQFTVSVIEQRIETCMSWRTKNKYCGVLFRVWKTLNPTAIYELQLFNYRSSSQWYDVHTYFGLTFWTRIKYVKYKRHL